MESIITKQIKTRFGDKSISVFSCNIIDFDMEIDILTTSAFYRSYHPVPKTMFQALDSIGIQVSALARKPEIDMRELCNIWLSEKVFCDRLNVHRIGCIEMDSFGFGKVTDRSVEENILLSIKAYFRMLDIASDYGIKMDTLAMPLIGAGIQQISSDLTLIPLINECVEFLKRNESVKRIYFIDYNQRNAFNMAMKLENSYSMQKEREIFEMPESPLPVKNDNLLFISYTSHDKNVADNLCAKLESRGIKVWYAPRNIHNNDYATAIVDAITKCTHFVVIISKESMMSEHVLNEIDLAFKELRRDIRFLPLRIDGDDLKPAFAYYLSRQHWMDAQLPPLERRLEEFADRIAGEIGG